MRWSNALFMISGFAALGMSFHPKAASRDDGPDPQPILAAHCVSCHGGASPAARLDLSKGTETLSSLYVVAKGDPDNSLIIKRVTGKGGRPMPPNGPPLSDGDVATLRDWIHGLKPDPTRVFQQNCIKCHGGARPAGHLDLTPTLAGISASPDVVRGDPDDSVIIKRITANGAPLMPPGNKPLSDADIKVVKDWVASYNDPTPIIYGRCMPCHRGANPAGGLNLAKSPKELAALTEITKGDPDNSVLVQRITGKLKPQMPPGGHNLSDDDIAFIESWIKGLKSE
jgi:mono/diheme cytochrome c family protein